MVKNTVKGTLLLVDDDRFVLNSMADWLRSCQYEVDTAVSISEARILLKAKQYDIAIVDIQLGDDGDGVLLLREISHSDKENMPLVILVTGYGTVESAISAIRAGAFDFLTKPLIDAELEMAIERALHQRDTVSENKHLKRQLERRYGLENIVGNDHRMQRIYDVIESVAATRATILITGESGTGKSVIARAIHQKSDRRNKPFIEVASGALPENLLESELFGHIVGSFTGAVGNKVGKFKAADGGTIFLDEIGTASQGLQVKLLRVLQELAFEMVGSSETIHVDTRVILATNENLEKAVAEGRFRQDLYYRINVINIEIPPLRERIADIPLLTQHFFENICREAHKNMIGIDPQVILALQNYSWPGNVRQLQNVIERAVLLGKHDMIVLDDLSADITGSLSGGLPPIGLTEMANKSLKETLTNPERQIILEVLEMHHWNRNATAEALGINRTTLYKKMKKLGLDEQKALH
ncbi:MAG: sigma-54 dependent transcriptional regulator [Planctomycetaceae bacterium]|jgi:DNA-binding NtrC family response regulator|nr:sigma-54 dependent transcriptional regulator [Planctomycetaceae bacterium]